ncbi:MAG: hypothetical protein Q9217_004446 [Psora testacea]
MPRPASLSLAMPKGTSAVSSTVTSPADAGSGMSSPANTNANPVVPGPSAGHHKASKSEATGLSEPQSLEIQPTSQEITSLPPFPSSPKNASRHAREPSKGFFSNLKASKSSNKIHHVESTIRQVSEEIPRSQEGSEQESIYTLRKSSGSTPDLSLSNFDASSTDDRQGRQIQRKNGPRRPVGVYLGSDSAITAGPTGASYPRKPKPRFSNLISRTRSIRVDDGGRKSKPSTPNSATVPVRRMQYDGISEVGHSKGAPRTAPLNPDRSLREMMASGIRNHSVDRQSSNHSSEHVVPRRIEPSSSSSNSNSGLSSSTSGVLREGTGTYLFANIKNTSTKAADGIGRASKGILGKMNRSGSSTAEKDERYVLRIINLPLVEQTRRTRIAARLEDSKDKTEFWMPALPWRCIDYLNFRGCEEEGLYRVPGSDIQIRHWQKRFDREGDINLFNEPDLYDINIIGSMFKAWLRELPTEIFPKVIQAKIAKECSEAQQVPQLLRDELSMLPPWNYYLLFAITCHLSLLTAYADKNKMTYSNLCICFQPALKIDAFCFQFLVQRWRDCWQGCYTEKEALEDEYRVLEGLASSSGESSNGSTAVCEERSLASSASNKAISNTVNQGKPPPLILTRAGNEPPPSTPARQVKQNGHATAASQLPELAPVKPLSPLLSDY